MRCPDCNKFVSLDADTEPEVESDDLDEGQDELNFRVSVKITNNCAECSTELREATFECDDTFDTEPEKDVEYTMEIDDLGRSEKSEGKGRGTKTFYGFEATAVLYGDGKELERKSIGDYIQASYMDEL